MDIVIFGIIGFTLVLLVVLSLGKRRENRQRRFLAIFSEGVPSKRACPEEMGLLQEIARKVVAAHLEAATLAMISRQETQSLETVRQLAATERRALRLAEEATKLARSFGLVPRSAKTARAFADMNL